MHDDQNLRWGDASTELYQELGATTEFGAYWIRAFFDDALEPRYQPWFAAIGAHYGTRLGEHQHLDAAKASANAHHSRLVEHHGRKGRP